VICDFSDMNHIKCPFCDHELIISNDVFPYDCYCHNCGQWEIRIKLNKEILWIDELFEGSRFKIEIEHNNKKLSIYKIEHEFDCNYWTHLISLDSSVFTSDDYKNINGFLHKIHSMKCFW
jgi:transcription elongation factor Elf1